MIFKWQISLPVHVSDALMLLILQWNYQVVILSHCFPICFRVFDRQQHWLRVIDSHFAMPHYSFFSTLDPGPWTPDLELTFGEITQKTAKEVCCGFIPVSDQFTIHICRSTSVMIKSGQRQCLRRLQVQTLGVTSHRLHQKVQENSMAMKF